LSTEDIYHLSTSITSSEIEAAMKSLQKKIPGPDGFTAKFYQTFKDLTPTLLKSFHDMENEGTIPHSFYEVGKTLIPKPDKYTTKKRIIGHSP
jgi:hypothetical protein